MASVEPEILRDMARNGGGTFVNFQQARKRGMNPAALETLLVWLERDIRNNYKLEMLRLLTDPRYVEDTLDRILDIFRRADGPKDQGLGGLRPMIMSLLAPIAPARIRSQLIEIIEDPRYGPSRGMAVVAATRGRRCIPELVPSLLRWAREPQGRMDLMSLRTLVRWKVQSVRPEIERLLASVDERVEPYHRGEERTDLRRLSRRLSIAEAQDQG